MKIAIIGGGPAGLYSAILLKKQRPEAEVTVYERNRADDTFGFGVVFSDATLDKVCPVAGSPKQCIERLEEYHSAGCTQMMLELWGDDRLQQARLFGEKVLPHFRAKRRQ